ncbi:YheC/YheD family endospore coat-associated protein [Bacillus cihuensis]|uniref:YheC/YheD family endospore coat-associated protein n=1 Tax=Bacillus cihuensis TaxID=1208599 RepID=UPI00040FC798|nr:YheC/YheD family protein [Bacillus cihuensis]
MKLYYDLTNQLWKHRSSGQKAYFGQDLREIPFSEEVPLPSFSVQTKLEHGNRILTVGIMTCQNKKNDFGIAGNLPLFYDLHQELLKHGIFSFIFTAEDALTNTRRGLVYSVEYGKWMKVSVPKPCVIYNRIPFRSFEETSTFQSLLNDFKARNIAIFNPGFFHKYDMFEALAKSPDLSRFLPETILLSSSQVLKDFLEHHREIYIKPGKGNRGYGIAALSLTNTSELIVKKTNGTETYPAFDHFWKSESDRLLRKKYIAQRAIKPKKIRGHRFDYRILVHYQNGVHLVTGKAVRLSQSQEVTTHIPKGGKLYPYNRLQSAELDEQFKTIAEQCGIILSKAFGFFGEFSIDIGEDLNGNLFIYEVNTKPMQFDEPEIERARHKHLRQIFREIGLPKLLPR